jgi:SET domain-containing protein
LCCSSSSEPETYEPGIILRGEVMSTGEGERRQVAYYAKGELNILHSMKVEDKLGGYSFDMTKKGNVARFINHSCDPNLAMWKLNNDRAVVAYAKKKIEGEEREITKQNSLCTELICLLAFLFLQLAKS